MRILGRVAGLGVSRGVMVFSLALMSIVLTFGSSELSAENGALAPQSVTEAASKVRDQVMPYVVSILVIREDYQQGEPVLSVSSGSGTVITEAGHIATNAHVTNKGKIFRVIFSDGRELSAKLVGSDPASDLAVLQLQPDAAEKFAFTTFESIVNLKAGDTVLAMGAPWGLSNSMSAGVVNNPRRLLVSLFDDEADYESYFDDDVMTGRYYAWIQHDAAIAPGNSGGPLVNLEGRLVGVNTRGMMFGGDLAFAIPAPDVSRVVAQLIANGKVERSFHGFRIRSLKGTDHKEGVLVTAVERGSPARKADLRAGDRILKINDQAITARTPVDVPEYQRLIAELPKTEQLKLQVDRDGKTLEIAMRGEPLVSGSNDERAFAPFGLSLAELTSQMSRRRSLEAQPGLLVTGVRPGGPAATARPVIPYGAVIRRIDGNEVGKLSQLSLWSRPTNTKHVLIVFEYDGEQKLAMLTPTYGDVSREPLPTIAKAWSGVEVQPITKSQANQMGLPEQGYRISRVYAQSPMERAGAKVGDIIRELNGEPFNVSSDSKSEPFHHRVREQLVGEPMEFTVLRKAKTVKLKVVPEESPVTASGLKTQSLLRLRAQIRELGFYDRQSRKLPATVNGILIEGVESGGPAGLAHINAGDVVIRVGERKVENLQQFSDAIQSELDGNGRLIDIEVIRGSESRILFMDRLWLKESLK